MQLHVKYITDTKGDRTGVLVPFKEWTKIISGYRNVKQCRTLKSGFNDAFREIEAIRKGKAKPVILRRLLDEQPSQTLISMGTTFPF
jgi:hypothetical protein